PTFNLDGIYVMHRQLVLRFIYSALSQNRGMLGRLVTDASKVKIDGPKAAPGDMDQYGSIIELMPVGSFQQARRRRQEPDSHVSRSPWRGGARAHTYQGRQHLEDRHVQVSARAFGVFLSREMT